MDINDILDQQTMDAILADAKASGISAEEVKAVLGTLTDEKRAPKRSAASQGELMSLLDDDKDAVVGDIADATGVERGKTGTILMLAAPFLLKYLFSSGSSGNNSNMSMMLPLLALMGGGQQQSSGMGLLGSLLGGGQTQQAAPTSLLGALLGGGQSQQSAYNQNSLFSSLLGTPVQQQSYSSNSTSALLGSLLGSQTAQAQPQQQSGLLDLLSGSSVQPVQQQPQSAGTGGLLSALFNILGDNG